MTALVLGGASWNTMIYLQEFPAPGPQTLHDCRFHENVGSTGTGKAFALRALGEGVILHAALGQDDAAERIRAACDARGVTVIEEHDPDGTPRHTNLMNDRGERISIFLVPGSGQIAVDLARLAAPLARAEVIFLNIVPSSLPVLPMLESVAAPIWLDLHDWDGQNPWHAQFLPYGDVVQLSDEAIGARKEHSIHALLDGRASAVVLTKGAAGAEIFLADGSHIQIPPCPASQVVDSNGAGDSFMVALWHARKSGSDWAAAGLFAAKMAAQTVACADLAPERFEV